MDIDALLKKTEREIVKEGTADFVASRGEYLSGCVMAALLASTIIADPVTALLNVIVPAVSLVVYEIFFRRNVEALEAERRAALAAEGAAG